MTLSFALIVTGFVLVAPARYVFWFLGQQRIGNLLASVGWLLQFAAYVIEHDVVSAVFCGLFAAWTLWRWWRGGGGDQLKKAARELGDKSRRRIQQLVDQLVPSPIPSPARAAS